MLDIVDVTSDGVGVGRFSNGMAVFVPLTAVGDRISCHIVKVNKSYAYGIIREILVPSGDRIASDCPAFSKCGGCSFRHISYEAELKLKSKFVTDAFSRGKVFEAAKFEKICGSADICRYRNKAQFPISKSGDQIIYGFYGKRSHRVIPIKDCLLEPEIFSGIMAICVSFMEDNNISVYDETAKKGILRHIYIRRGHNSGEIMVCFVALNQTVRDKLSCLAKKLKSQFADIKSVILNINPDNTNVILGKKNITLLGGDQISDTICGLKIRLSPMSFYQVNTDMAGRLYEYAKSCVGDMQGSEHGLIIDLYCGAGAIGLFFADRAEEVIGCDITREAIENAKENARINGIENAEFIAGDAGEIAADLAKSGKNPDIIIIDPPRKGCDKLTLDSIIKMQPKKIIMISCHPATAARDAAYIENFSYQLKTVKPFDLFPRTTHVECVALFEQIGSL